MRFPAAILSATLLLFGGASVAAAKVTTHKYVGEIASIDAAARTVSVKKHAQDPAARAMTFSIASGAKIMAGANPEDLGKLAVGDPVTVTYVTNGDAHLATRIDLARPPATGPAKTSPY